MATCSGYPFNHHPCFSSRRDLLWQRIHLPVAPLCNIKCAFCSHSMGSSCHTSMPGASSQIMTPHSAVDRTRLEIERNPQLKIVAISGPGEPLANPETFQTLEMIRKESMDIEFCLSTNGLLLELYVDWLEKMNVETISISMSTTNISTASKIYEWAKFQDLTYRNAAMASRIIDAQLRGISNATKAGVYVKVNTILIPDVNMQDIVDLAVAVADAGATLQNIVPLFPNDKFSSLRVPSPKEVDDARREAAEFINQFSYCKQCRSDVVGIPGCDTIL